MKMMKSRWPLLAVAAFVIAALAIPVVASADHAWGNYHWARQDNPLPLSLGDNVSGAWDTHLAIANDDWNQFDQSSVLANKVDAGRTSPRRCNPDSGLVEICKRVVDVSDLEEPLDRIRDPVLSDPLDVGHVEVSGQHQGDLREVFL